MALKFPEGLFLWSKVNPLKTEDKFLNYILFHTWTNSQHTLFCKYLFRTLFCNEGDLTHV